MTCLVVNGSVRGGRGLRWLNKVRRCISSGDTSSRKSPENSSMTMWPSGFLQSHQIGNMMSFWDTHWRIAQVYRLTDWDQETDRSC